jgi:rod shape-determining protein MreD
MNKRTHLYGILLAVTILQMICMKYTPYFPDIMILIVVFSGIFLGRGEGIRVGFAAGFLRGCLSIYTLPIDIFLFPAIGALSDILAERFYRQNPVIEMFVVAFALFFAVAFHAFYIKILAQNEFIGVWNIFMGNLRSIVVTIVFSPVFFHVLRGFHPQEE